MIMQKFGSQGRSIVGSELMVFYLIYSLLFATNVFLAHEFAKFYCKNMLEHGMIGCRW